MREDRLGWKMFGWQRKHSPITLR